MEAILLPIQPKFCEKILSGEKIIEVRKTRPKIDRPFKCYIYCTKGMELWGDGTGNTWRGIDPDEDVVEVFRLNSTLTQLNGKVIGEFVCCGMMRPYSDLTLMAKHSCLTIDELNKYSNGKELFGWRISDLKIYDYPKDINEFYKQGIPIKIRPSQSWCYVEMIV